LNVSDFQGRWNDLDITHWQRRIEHYHQQILQLYPTGCLGWLREFEPGRVVQLKATVTEIRRAYAARDSQGLDAALICYRDSHLEIFQEYLVMADLDKVPAAS
jgi:hypothetical protein